MYRPIQTSSGRRSNTTSFMAKKGENLRDLPQLLDTSFALKIENYLLTAEGGLKMRGGRTSLHSESGSNGFQILDKRGWTNDLVVIGWGSNISVYRISTDTFTTVKSDFNIPDRFDGERYGDYFMVSSPGDRIGRMSFTLNYDNQTANFNVGSIVTGLTSGATAIILEDSDSGTTGTLTLGTISGTFEDNEVISDNGTSPGSARVDGTLTFTYAEIANAPRAIGVTVAGARLIASLPGGSQQYSDVDEGSNPPFDTWNNSSTATHGGIINYRAAGEIVDTIVLSEIIVVFAENGKWAYHLQVLDSGGILQKIEQTDMFRLDGGGAKGVLIADTGVYYTNNKGFWRLVGIGQQNIPYSKQEAITSKLLGNSYFDDVDLTNCDLVEYRKENTILITVRKNSDANNYIIAFNTELNAFSRITGWKIKSFANINGVLYGGDSIENKLFKLFDGWTDDGASIWTDFDQEVQTGALWTKKVMLGQYVQGKLSQSTELDWRFSIYDQTGAYKKDKLKLRWTAQRGVTIAEELGSSEFGSSTFGGDRDLAKTVESFDGLRCKIRNFQRLGVRFSGWHKAPHQINWFSIEIEEKNPIRRRKLTKIS